MTAIGTERKNIKKKLTLNVCTGLDLGDPKGEKLDLGVPKGDVLEANPPRGPAKPPDLGVPSPDREGFLAFPFCPSLTRAGLA